MSQFSFSNLLNNLTKYLVTRINSLKPQIITPSNLINRLNIHSKYRNRINQTHIFKTNRISPRKDPLDQDSLNINEIIISSNIIKIAQIIITILLKVSIQIVIRILINVIQNTHLYKMTGTSLRKDPLDQVSHNINEIIISYKIIKIVIIIILTILLNVLQLRVTNKYRGSKIN